MVLNLIGIGLNDEKDITFRGFELVQKSDYIYLENYTSLLNASIQKLEEFYKKRIILADRDLIENRAEETILKYSKESVVSLLVVGDPMSATTHVDIMMRAKALKIPVNIVNNASIMTAIGITGLQLYKFGKTTSIPFSSSLIETPYDVIKQNKSNGLHTLVLLDIKVDENKFMTINEALKILQNIENKRGEKIILPDTKVIACARLGAPDYLVRYGQVKDLVKQNFGQPLHSLIVPGELHFMEEEALMFT